jgi:DNA-binding transcriptional regulator YhcF (GntR family)
MLYLLIMTFKWGKDSPFPSYARLGRMMGVSARMVARYAAGLEEKGYMRRTRRRGTTNEFNLSQSFEKIASLPVTRKEEARFADRAKRLREDVDL